MLFNLPEMRRKLAAIDAERAPLAALIVAAEGYEASLAGVFPTAYESDSADDINEAVERHRRGRRANRSPDLRVRGPRKGPVTMETVKLALELANVFEMPVSTADVVAEMRVRGMQLPDKNPNNVISARLSNSDELEGHRGLGWWPKNKPLPVEVNGHSLLDPQIGHEEGGADVSLNA